MMKTSLVALVMALSTSAAFAQEQEVVIDTENLINGMDHVDLANDFLFRMPDSSGTFIRIKPPMKSLSYNYRFFLETMKGSVELKLTAARAAKTGYIDYHLQGGVVISLPNVLTDTTPVRLTKNVKKNIPVTVALEQVTCTPRRLQSLLLNVVLR